MTSADITRELRGTRPVAPEALRERVRTIVAAEPPARPAFGARLAALLPRGCRSALVLVPAAVLGVAVAAGVVQLVRPDGSADVAAPATTAPSLRSSAPTDDAAESTPPAAKTDGATAGAGGVTPSTAAPALPAPSTDRAQRTAVSLALEVDDPEALSAAAQRTIVAIRALGGYLVTVQVGTSTSGSASIVARVPAGRVQDAVARLSALGRITSQNVQIDDLQASLDDVERQMAVLRRRIAAITAQLDAGGLSTDERTRLERTRQALRDELAHDRRSGQAIRGEAAYATIDLQIRTPEERQVVPPPPSRIDRALDDMARILAVEGIVLLYVLVVLVPLALAGGLLWTAVRLLGRRGRDRLLEAS